MTIPDRSDGISNSPHPEPDAPAVRPAGAWRQRFSLLVGISLVAFYLLSSLWIASHRRLWYDEISTVLIARLPDFGTIWDALTNGADVLPANYFMLVRIFDRALGPAEFAARIPSALALALGLLITFDCARRLSDNLHALASLALLSCSLLPYYGYEARPYGLYFMFAAAELWLWVHAPDNRKSSTILFGVTFFLAFSVHYYSALCLLPYAVFEASTWKPWSAPSHKLLAGSLGVLCGVALFSRQILAASRYSHGFWAAPHPRTLLEAFGQFFPFGLSVGAAVLIWIVWTARPEKLLLDPMLPSEAVGWYFLLIPIAGYVAATLVTNAFHNRYFIGMLAGVAVALAGALWRNFHCRPGVSAVIVLVMLFIGVGLQAYVTARPSKIEPPAAPGETERMSEALKWEALAMKDGKKSIAVAADGIIGLELRYYSKHPERYAFVRTPNMLPGGRTMQKLALYQPMRFWSLEDLRAAARDTVLVDPSDEMLRAVIDAGFQIRERRTREIKIVYLE